MSDFTHDFEQYDCWFCKDTKKEFVHKYKNGECVRTFTRTCSFCEDEDVQYWRYRTERFHEDAEDEVGDLGKIGEGFLNSLKWWFFGAIGIIVGLVALLAWKW